MTRWSSKPPGPKPIRPCSRSDTVTIAVQVNGKRRGEIEIARGADKAAVEAGGAGA